MNEQQGERDWSRSGATLERESEWLPRDLPSRATRSLAVFLITAFACGMLIVCFVTFPESVHCRFTLLPKGGTEPVRSPRDGVVDRVFASVGGPVRAGEPLCVVRSAQVRELDTQRATLKQEVTGARKRLVDLQAEARARQLADDAEIGELKARIDRLQGEQSGAEKLDKVLEARHASTLAAARSKEAQYEQELALERERLAMSQEVLDRIENLMEIGAAGKFDLLSERYRFSGAKIELERARGRLDESRASIRAAEDGRRVEVNQRKQEATRRLGELVEATESLNRAWREKEARSAAARRREGELTLKIETDGVRLDSLERELKNAEGDLLNVMAPYDGTVVKLGAQRPGVVIERGQMLCELARSGAELEAELAVPQNLAGRVAGGQPVRLLFDAFPYTRYGGQAAKLLWVSPVAGEDDTFRALADLENPRGNDEQQPLSLRAGMGGEGRIQIGHRTLLQFFLQPLGAVREKLTVME